MFNVDIAFIAGGNPAITAVWMITSRSSSTVRPALSDERRWTGSCDERPVATSARDRRDLAFAQAEPRARIDLAVRGLDDQAPEVTESLDRRDRRSPCTSRSFSRPRSYRSSSGMSVTSHGDRATRPTLPGGHEARWDTEPPWTSRRITDETEALEASPADRRGDQRMILGNTGQNVLGLAIGAIATFAANVLMTHRLGDDGFGIVTLTTQFAFIAAAATRFGMDVANVRLVAILVGRGQAARARGARPTFGRDRRGGVDAGRGRRGVRARPVARRVVLAGSRSGDRPSGRPRSRSRSRALAFTYMGATRGLKIMRFTLYAQWIAQPIGWIVLTIAMWAGSRRHAGVATARVRGVVGRSRC